MVAHSRYSHTVWQTVRALCSPPSLADTGISLISNRSYLFDRTFFHLTFLQVDLIESRSVCVCMWGGGWLITREYLLWMCSCKRKCISTGGGGGTTWIKLYYLPTRSIRLISHPHEIWGEWYRILSDILQTRRRMTMNKRKCENQSLYRAKPMQGQANGNSGQIKV